MTDGLTGGLVGTGTVCAGGLVATALTGSGVGLGEERSSPSGGFKPNPTALACTRAEAREGAALPIRCAVDMTAAPSTATVTNPPIQAMMRMGDGGV